MADEKKLVFWTRKHYGRLDAFIRDPEVAQAVFMINDRNNIRVFNRDQEEWSISWDEMEGLKKIGYSFRQILDPKRKVATTEKKVISN